MRTTNKSVALVLMFAFAVSACSSSAPDQPQPSSAPSAEESNPTQSAPAQPSATATAALLDLEIVEWFEHAIPNLADPSITDTQIEILVRNPNTVPVRVNTDELEFRLINAAGEVVYTNESAYFSLWEGSWMLAGDSTGFQVCACFESSGGEKQEWEVVELHAPIEAASDVSYTTDVEASLGEPFSLAEAHLGGNGTGIPITLANTSDLALTSIPMRVIARDANGRYIGMAAFGNSVASFTEDIQIQPGDSAQGVLDSEIDYFDGPLIYEVVAIGIPASLTATAEIELPSGTPVAEWEGISVMPGAIGGQDVGAGYQFTIQATTDEITGFYEEELARLGYEFTGSDEGEYTTLYFTKSGSNVLVAIVPLGNLSGVLITTAE
jgi:hypothetical protein